jgi:hypothetical protein
MSFIGLPKNAGSDASVSTFQPMQRAKGGTRRVAIDSQLQEKDGASLDAVAEVHARTVTEPSDV